MHHTVFPDYFSKLEIQRELDLAGTGSGNRLPKSGYRSQTGEPRAKHADKKGSHVLVKGSLVSTTYERGNGKGKKANQQADVLGE